jgi:hypothetical protein
MTMTVKKVYHILLCIALVWTAPEHLRNVDMLPPEMAKSQAGDVYSFAIILHETEYRCLPFQLGEYAYIAPSGKNKRLSYI